MWNGRCEEQEVEASAVLKRYATRGLMDGRRDTILTSERPIRKPRFPLSQDFERSERDTVQSIEEVALRDQRAYFYRRDTTESGAPVYDFVITVEKESH